MIYQRISLFLILTGFLNTLISCGALFSEQEWSENYALMKGVKATVPQMIDGKLNTIGETTFPAGSQNSYGSNPTSEVVVVLAEKKVIRRIVLHSDNITELAVYADRGSIVTEADWQLIKDVKSVKSSPIQISLLIPFPTDRIRLRVLGTKDDALLNRQQRARYGGGRLYGGGNRRAPGKIREIELYGYKSTEQMGEEKASDAREKELDDLLELE